MFPMPDTLRRTALALVVVALTACATLAADDARRSVVAAERAFAAMSAERGIRAAFLASFADDGIGFEPAPMVLKERWSARPAPANPTERTLAWHPVVAGVARSGALGFTSGPSRFVDTSGKLASWDGVYFSVWRRGADGTWKVAADAGITTPGAVSDAGFGPDPIVRASPVAIEIPSSLDGADARASGDRYAFAAALADDARWHVDDRAPVVGRDAVVAARASDARTLRFVTRGREAASTQDLGYTYGTIASGDATAGHYLHLWTRGADGGWRLLVAVHLGAGGS
jgi:ketosteroid isomerase-like protein